MTLKCPKCGSTDIQEDSFGNLPNGELYCNTCHYSGSPVKFEEGTLYFECLKVDEFEIKFFEIIQEFLQSNHIKLCVTEAELKNAFDRWVITLPANHSTPLEAVDEFLELNDKNFWYFDKLPSKDTNFIKQTCKELGMTYKQLGELIGYSEPAIKKAAQTNTVSEPMQKAIELYKEVLTLRLKLINTNKLKKALKELLE